MDSYDFWKTNAPEPSVVCEICGCGEIEYLFGFGKIGVCRVCYAVLERERKEEQAGEDAA